MSLEIVWKWTVPGLTDFDPVSLSLPMQLLDSHGRTPTSIRRQFLEDEFLLFRMASTL